VKKLPVIVAFLILCAAFPSAGQVIDSAKVERLTHFLDSLDQRSQIQFHTDSFKILSWSDSLKYRIQSKFSFDSLNYQGKIASLSNLQLPTSKYAAKNYAMERSSRKCAVNFYHER
jgi:hypothetical protein